MAQELFFEVRRNKSHVYLDAEDNQTVLDLKKMLAAIDHNSVETLELWKLDEEGRKTQLLHDTATLLDCGYTPQNAKAQCPATIGMRVINQEDTLQIADVSTPPPIPDTMRQDPTPTD